MDKQAILLKLELAATLVDEARGGLGRLDAPVDESEPEAPESEQPEPEQPEAKPGPSYLVIGKGAALPGEVATVEVLGQTSVDVTGFGGYVGCPNELELIGSKVPDSFIELLGLENPRAVAVQKKAGGVGSFLSLMLFFNPLISYKTTEIHQLRLPPMTPFLELQFRVPADAPPGERYNLDSESKKYGRLIRNGKGHSRRLTVPPEYSTWVFRWGIRPICVSGWVDVL